MTEGLKEALAASIDFQSLEGRSFDWLLARKAELLGDTRSLNELTHSELMEYHAISIRLRQTATPAGKPGAAPKRGKGRPRIDMDMIADDFG